MQGLEIIALVTVESYVGNVKEQVDKGIVKHQFRLCELRIVYNLINCSLIK